MITAASTISFYQEFLMARGNFNPADFGVDCEKSEFSNICVDHFGEYTKGQLSVDELLLRPETALDFCASIRRKFGWYDVPSDIILRSVLNARKH